MSSAPRVILLDSCAYFRLARSIHPLLAGTFGPAPPYSLFVFAALDDEYLTNSRLRNKFEWVNETEYREDRRRKCFSCKGKWAPLAATAFSFLAAYAKAHSHMLAPEDLKALAAGYVREVPVVSDDEALQDVATVHGIECWGTLELLKRMVDVGRIDMGKVNEILEYLENENDLPMPKGRLRERYAALFGTECLI